MRCHLVFATLHTNSAFEAVYRLQNMGIPAYMVAAVLRLVVAQRLIRKLCPACNAAGCPGCNLTGYSGRTVVAECIPVTLELSDVIAAGPDTGKLRAYLKSQSYKTLFDDANDKIAAGITTEAEARRELGVPR